MKSLLNSAPARKKVAADPEKFSLRKKKCVKPEKDAHVAIKT